MTADITSRAAANLAIAYASETLACRRYLACAAIAEEEGRRQAAAVFRRIAQRRSRHAEAHLQALHAQADLPAGIGSTGDNLRAAITQELHDYTDLYPEIARAARVEGFEDIAEQFETLARTGRSHAGLLQQALDTLLPSSSVGFSG
jgi:rubrerythrin